MPTEMTIFFSMYATDTTVRKISAVNLFIVETRNIEMKRGKIKFWKLGMKFCYQKYVYNYRKIC